MALTEQQVNSIADAVIAKRVTSAIANRVNARGGTAADQKKVAQAIAAKLT